MTNPLVPHPGDSSFHCILRGFQQRAQVGSSPRAPGQYPSRSPPCLRLSLVPASSSNKESPSRAALTKRTIISRTMMLFTGAVLSLMQWIWLQQPA